MWLFIQNYLVHNKNPRLNVLCIHFITCIQKAYLFIHLSFLDTVRHAVLVSFYFI